MSIEPCWCSSDCEIPYGTCHCGCGGETTIAIQNSTDRGWVRGRPIFYLRGHAPRTTVEHKLSDIDESTRTANCGRCKQVVTIKRATNRKTGWQCCYRLMTDHRLSEIDLKAKTAYCRGCQERVPIIAGGSPRGRVDKRWKCAIFSRALARSYREDGNPNVKHTAWREANRDRLRAAHIAKNYGLSADAYAQMLIDQEDRCVICRRLPSGGPRDKVLHVDHRHSDGVIRGLLCHDCNKGLGAFKDDPELLAAAIAYLQKAPAVEQV